ncbi:stonin-1 [Ctenodactylus gundi]
MCSTNPGNWVTFDDDPAFQSPKQRNVPAEKPGARRPNGLPLDLPGLKGFSSGSSSAGSTPLPSPVVDFYFSPGPPSNSPLSTPTKDFPGFPGVPKAGAHALYPIPESSSGCPLPAAEAGSSFLPAKPTCSPPAFLPGDPSCVSPSDLSPQRAENPGVQSEAPRFQDFREGCAFSSPFWKDEGSASPLAFDSPAGRRTLPSRDRDLPADARSLNTCSLGYVCERLERLLSVGERSPLGEVSASSPPAGACASSFVPHALFRSQPGAGWPFLLRIPEKKNMMSSRQWGPVFLRVLPGGILQLYYERGLDRPFRELQLDGHCRLSEPRVESCGVAGKIHTVKVEHVAYTERRRCHGKAEAAHEADVEQMLKLGTPDHRAFRDFVTAVEDALLWLPAAPRPRKSYEEQELALEVVDNFWGRVTKGHAGLAESAVVTRVFCLSFLNGSAECFLTLDDPGLQKRAGGRSEAGPARAPMASLDHRLHPCARGPDFEQSGVVRFVPPDACRFELMRFRTSYRGGELPFSLKSLVAVQGACVELQAFVHMAPAQRLSPAGSWSCENIAIHFPVPSQWVKALWTMHLQRQKSLKARMNRRACLGSGQEPEAGQVVQVTVGAAEYESAYQAVVWRIERLPDKNSGPDHPHCLSYKLELGSDQEIPSDWSPFATVQFSMQDTCASGTQVRTLGVESDVQPQKHIQQRACYNVQVEIEKKWIKIDGEDPEKAGGCVPQ